MILGVSASTADGIGVMRELRKQRQLYCKPLKPEPREIQVNSEGKQARIVTSNSRVFRCVLLLPALRLRSMSAPRDSFPAHSFTRSFRDTFFRRVEFGNPFAPLGIAILGIGALL